MREFTWTHMCGQVDVVNVLALLQQAVRYPTVLVPTAPELPADRPEDTAAGSCCVSLCVTVHRLGFCPLSLSGLVCFL